MRRILCVIAIGAVIVGLVILVLSQLGLHAGRGLGLDSSRHLPSIDLGPPPRAATQR